jgi:hypothetical protein
VPGFVVRAAAFSNTVDARAERFATLPNRFEKIRYYGWMSPNSNVRVEEVKWLA